MKNTCKKKVSIIVPFYNTNNQLFEECLKSIANQTYKNIEAILINDGSTNHQNIETASDYSQKHGFKIINKNNGGVSSARNLGLRIATGDYILFVDSDDTIDNDCVDSLLLAAEKNNCNIVLSGKKNNITKKIDIPFKNKTIDLVKDSNTIALFLTSIASQGVLFELSIAKNYHFNEKMKKCEDIDYMLTILSDDSARAYVSGDGKYTYIQNEESVTHDNEVDEISNSFIARRVAYETLDNIAPISKNTKRLLIIINISKAIVSISSRNEALMRARKNLKKILSDTTIRYVRISEIIKRKKYLSKTQIISIILLDLRLYTLVLFLGKVKYGKQKYGGRNYHA